ncbi:Hypothetical predicted protein [Xyrichtys novacula]|uniref:Uncharacterized protein n=1 Tax=Xyrichtys novacula TaxID=13765 RepID=A0AAV1ET29_XYRNO|nr:Hypothetical predicted protein [Xyrichtys novacula]
MAPTVPTHKGQYQIQPACRCEGMYRDSTGDTACLLDLLMLLQRNITPRSPFTTHPQLKTQQHSDTDFRELTQIRSDLTWGEKIAPATAQLRQRSIFCKKETCPFKAAQTGFL